MGEEVAAGAGHLARDSRRQELCGEAVERCKDEGEIKENMRKVTTAPDSRLAGYWRINEGPGGMIFDHSSHGNLGPIKGSPAWTASTHPVSEVGAAS